MFSTILVLTISVVCRSCMYSVVSTRYAFVSVSKHKFSRRCTNSLPCKHAFTCQNWDRTRPVLPALVWFCPSYGTLKLVNRASYTNSAVCSDFQISGPSADLILKNLPFYGVECSQFLWITWTRVSCECLGCHKQISRAWMSNYIPTVYFMGYNYSPITSYMWTVPISNDKSHEDLKPRNW